MQITIRVLDETSEVLADGVVLVDAQHVDANSYIEKRLAGLDHDSAAAEIMDEWGERGSGPFPICVGQTYARRLDR